MAFSKVLRKSRFEVGDAVWLELGEEDVTR